MSQPKPMRQAMPGVAAFIDSMRGAFGDAVITAAMRTGASDARDGRGNNFWAVEGDNVIGNPWSHWPRTGPCMPPTKAGIERDRKIDISQGVKK